MINIMFDRHSKEYRDRIDTMESRLGLGHLFETLQFEFEEFCTKNNIEYTKSCITKYDDVWIYYSINKDDYNLIRLVHGNLLTTIKPDHIIGIINRYNTICQ